MTTLYATIDLPFRVYFLVLCKNSYSSKLMIIRHLSFDFIALFEQWRAGSGRIVIGIPSMSADLRAHITVVLETGDDADSRIT